jgi:hypothetical protein
MLPCGLGAVRVGDQAVGDGGAELRADEGGRGSGGRQAGRAGERLVVAEAVDTRLLRHLGRGGGGDGQDGQDGEALRRAIHSVESSSGQGTGDPATAPARGDKAPGRGGEAYSVP